jgi:hypothetical protein
VRAVRDHDPQHRWSNRRSGAEGPAPRREQDGLVVVDDSTDPFYEDVPAWTLPAIVVGLTALTGSSLLFALISIVAMMWIFAVDDGARRRARGVPPPGS